MSFKIWLGAPQAVQWFANEANNSKNTADSEQAAGANSAEYEAAAAGAAAAEPGTEAAGENQLQQCQHLLTKAQEEAASFKDKWQRSHAEMQNLIARQAREKETLQTYAVQKFAQSLLEVADNLESAVKAAPKDVLQAGADVSVEKALGYLKSLLEGVQATERVLLKNMASQGVQRLEIADGDSFDPNTQEAMSTIPTTSPAQTPGTIAAVWQSGYKIHDRILRAAKVIVYHSKE
eukprot:GHRR01022189.1.p1 GENE.GHRR01022189.1~~GHRR01022189.1.p1  ORF type:complete len:235 (+),score=106.21 GHRR01022189.1:318-1022(+)